MVVMVCWGLTVWVQYGGCNGFLDLIVGVQDGGCNGCDGLLGKLYGCRTVDVQIVMVCWS